MGGCTGLSPAGRKGADSVVVEVALPPPVMSSAALLACLDDMRSIERKQFDAAFALAEERLTYELDADVARFICLSLNAKADYEQFKHGTLVLEQYLEGHPGAGKDLRGFQIMVDQLDHAIENKWTSWKTLLNDKKALKAEVESLKARVEEQQRQIEQLKSIEDIIKSREAGQP